ncbi:MAG: hypothetical protein SAK29_15760 [Scytonema sp. PMC 1069.18]|nr:hypothetical protein [Scytonema sp. PMC 1069.18]MEC4886775.1 hypothetical protein [Scytonema sp. PMC 1070.18]
MWYGRLARQPDKNPRQPDKNPRQPDKNPRQLPRTGEDAYPTIGRIYFLENPLQVSQSPKLGNPPTPYTPHPISQ